MWKDVRNLYLTFSISFLALITSLFLPVSENYRIALFTTLSVPILYTTSYFQKKEAEKGKYFRMVEEDAITEIQVLMSSFIAGYIMYISSTMDLSLEGLLTFLIAFTIVNAMKYCLKTFYVSSRYLKVDPNNPYTIIVVSFVFACTFFLIECVICPLVGG